ncbi:MAG TPA: flagellin lysine-N-methylase [Pseudobacteroides sp.]|nr:flagellin lysine-N-methylase [Pseudobacteroides sp.]
MGDKKRAVLVPQYMLNFKCIGSECEDNCCIGWRVNIDHETYKKYQKIRDEELTPLCEQYVKRNRAQNHGESNYAKLKFSEDQKCPFLTENMLCRMQLKRGEEYLSDVCTIYPRIANTLNSILERSATMSCPEAARLALLNEEGIEFDEMEEPANIKNIVSWNINTHDLKFNNKPVKYLWELRVFTISLLQNRNYRLYERLIILGMVFNMFQERVSEGKVNDIPGLIASYSNIIEDGSLRESLSSIPVQYNIQMKLLKEMADKRYLMGINSKRYLECFSDFLKGLECTVDAKVEEVGERYQKAYKEYYEPFMDSHEYILENYLVNYVFKNMFPFSKGESLFDSYMMMVLHFSLIKMLLIGMAGFHKKLTVDLVIKLIQSFSKTVEHNQKYLDRIADLMRYNGFNTMAYMAILIKN